MRSPNKRWPKASAIGCRTKPSQPRSKPSCGSRFTRHIVDDAAKAQFPFLVPGECAAKPFAAPHHMWPALYRMPPPTPPDILIRTNKNKTTTIVLNRYKVVLREYSE